MTDLSALKQQVVARVDELTSELMALSADLHAHPEIRFEERYAVERIIALLRSREVDPEVGTGGLATAFQAAVPGSGQGPTVAILAEYDALPGIGHACGHNLIAAAGVGAFLALAAARPDRGSVRLIGTPAEEGGGGKVGLLDAGVFAGVDVAMMIHPEAETRPLVDCAGRAALSIVFKGRASHAASAPDRGINALDAALLLFNAINALRQQTRDGSRIHGIIAEGGDAPNIIPARTRVELYVRAYDPAYLDELLRAVRACAEGAATATGCAVTMDEPSPAYAAMITNSVLAEHFGANLDALGHAWLPGRYRSYASTDAGNVSRALPVLHPFVGLGAGLDPHTVEFAAAAAGPTARRVVVDSARALAMTALDVLLDPAILPRARAAFEAEVGPR